MTSYDDIEYVLAEIITEATGEPRVGRLERTLAKSALARLREMGLSLSTPPADDVGEALATKWLTSYHGSIDATALTLAFKAGYAAAKVRPRGTVTDAPRVLTDPKGGCACEPFDQDAGGGHIEHLLEYEPDCPVHSTHLYDPRIGQWIMREKFEAARDARS